MKEDIIAMYDVSRDRVSTFPSSSTTKAQRSVCQRHPHSLSSVLKRSLYIFPFFIVTFVGYYRPSTINHHAEIDKRSYVTCRFASGIQALANPLPGPRPTVFQRVLIAFNSSPTPGLAQTLAAWHGPGHISHDELVRRLTYTHALQSRPPTEDFFVSLII